MKQQKSAFQPLASVVEYILGAIFIQCDMYLANKINTRRHRKAQNNG